MLGSSTKLYKYIFKKMTFTEVTKPPFQCIVRTETVQRFCGNRTTDQCPLANPFKVYFKTAFGLTKCGIQRHPSSYEFMINTIN